MDAVARAGEFVAAGGASGIRPSGPPLDRPDRPSPRVGAGRPPSGRRRRAVGAVRAPRRRRSSPPAAASTSCTPGTSSTLEAARALGDGLVVLLNSDASVRRLKGPGRPVHSQDDRARVLLGLSCVDAVVVFDEDDPRAALRRLRPDVWAKGGDYEDADLPEAALVRSWGGRVVLLPYLSGRSTTAVLQSIPSGDNP